MKNLVASFLTFAVLSLAPVMAAEDTETLCLAQQSATLGKDVKVKLSANWMMVENKQNGYILLSKAPTWTVYLFRPDRKIYAELSYKEILAKVALNGMAGATATACGLKTPKAHTTIRENGNTFFDYKFPGEIVKGYYLHDTSDRYNVISHFNLRTLQKAVPMEETVILSKLLSLPPAAGIPFSFISTMSNGHRNGALLTKTVATVKCACPDFSVLKKLTRTKNPAEIFASGDPSEIFDALTN